MANPPKLIGDVEALADEVIERTGKRIVLGMPLGLGKANHFANALYRRAKKDPELSLTIFTALTLQAPAVDNDLAKRFLEPMQGRFFGDYPELLYARDLRESQLPANVHVHEFYLQPANWLGDEQAQQNYVSLNYTHALRQLINSGINVVAQLLAAPGGNTAGEISDTYSMSCNPDIAADLYDLRAAGKIDFIGIGQVNRQLPFMHGPAKRSASDFDYILDDESLEFPLFMPPQKPVTLQNHAIGLHVAALIPDGGSLQIGIGAIGDAIAHALILRHRHNSLFRETHDRLTIGSIPSPELNTFDQGLYGVTEMLVEAFLDLIEAGILKREVDGCILHGGFFMGSPAFYRKLASLDPATRDKIHMTPVSFTNALYGDEMRKRQGRQKSRFINSAMMASLMGAVTSDGLENGQVVSGVGGQYNFVAQALELEGARAIITLPATRTKKGKTESNIVWSHGHVTIPRHLRDIVVTEYGVADLRGKSDADVIAAMLNIADSRFQADLLAQAKKAGKLPNDATIPPEYSNNTPHRIEEALQSAKQSGHLAVFPQGSDFTEEEEKLTLALQTLKQTKGSRRGMLSLAWQGKQADVDPGTEACLKRIALDNPKSFKQRIERLMVLGALSANG